MASRTKVVSNLMHEVLERNFEVTVVDPKGKEHRLNWRAYCYLVGRLPTADEQATMAQNGMVAFFTGEPIRLLERDGQTEAVLGEESEAPAEASPAPDTAPPSPPAP